ncbi:hypothetical protein KQX54_012222 [Cotesia glomerata]|uniref:Uncharacterized protein n=1 Tax=Cotesia glomerata TaxID=32391 RepID=A0AAV7IG76_COTGL|nr:hypothetical protein KQX54_012222 [Cotesia glomerata]
MINFRGVLETEEEYNKFLLEFNRYREAHNVKSFADLSELEKFLPTMNKSTRYHKNLLQSLKYCVLYDVIPLRDDIKEKSRHPERIIETRWPAHLSSLSSKFVAALKQLPNDAYASFLDSASSGVSKMLVAAAFKIVYPDRIMPESLYEKLRSIAFQELLRIHYPALAQVQMPRMVSFGEHLTIEWLKKHKIALKPQHQLLVERSRSSRSLRNQLKENAIGDVFELSELSSSSAVNSEVKTKRKKTSSSQQKSASPSRSDKAKVSKPSITSVVPCSIPLPNIGRKRTKTPKQIDAGPSTSKSSAQDSSLQVTGSSSSHLQVPEATTERSSTQIGDIISHKFTSSTPLSSSEKIKTIRTELKDVDPPAVDGSSDDVCCCLLECKCPNYSHTKRRRLVLHEMQLKPEPEIKIRA